MKEIAEIKEHLFERTGKGIKYDLTRMFQASECCGDAHNAFKKIHVAGTNGKGSTCTYLESMIRHQGYRTGLYTSPHIINFEERFVINGKHITELQWVEVYNDLQTVIDEFDLTFFEATTLIAFELFKRNNVEWAVIETGLGGRLDATNIITPCVSVITSIDMDHKEYLGDTILQIACEKFGIIKEGIPVVIVANKDFSVMDAVIEICNKKGASLSIVSDDEYRIVESKSKLSIVDCDGESYEVSMKGKFQALNASLAIKAFKACGFLFDNNAKSGMRDAYIPGRLQQLLYNGKTLIFDVGHNRQAANVLVKELSERYSQKTICVVTGIMSDKDYGEMIKSYLTIADRIVFTKPATTRAAATELLMSQINDKNNVTCIDNVGEACEYALGGNEEIICITGSFYTVGEACTYMKINPYLLKNG